MYRRALWESCLSVDKNDPLRARSDLWLSVTVPKPFRPRPHWREPSSRGQRDSPSPSVRVGPAVEGVACSALTRSSLYGCFREASGRDRRMTRTEAREPRRRRASEEPARGAGVVSEMELSWASAGVDPPGPRPGLRVSPRQRDRDRPERVYAKRAGLDNMRTDFHTV